jgi:hypothetical protein
LESATADRPAGEDTLAAQPAPALRAGAVAGIGARAGVGAGVAMIAWEMLAAEIATEPTAISGVGSSTWTPPTAIASFVLGDEAFSGSLAIGSIAFGLLLHLAVATVLGVVGAAALVYVLGYRPGPFGAGVCGAAYGLFLEIVALNLAVNAIQSPDVVYRAAPEWTWWVAHATYGITFGLLAARGLARRGDAG